jgi:hypothetical protein
MVRVIGVAKFEQHFATGTSNGRSLEGESGAEVGAGSLAKQYCSIHWNLR